MDDIAEDNWKGKKINKYFQQVKSRSRLPWPSAPNHSIVVPPAAISIEPFDPDIGESDEIHRATPLNNGNGRPPAGSRDDRHSPRPAPGPDPSGNVISVGSDSTTGRDGQHVTSSHCATNDIRRSSTTIQRHSCNRNMDTCRNFPPHGSTGEMNNGQVKVSVDHHPFNRPLAMNSKTGIGGGAGTRPRKRFRKKVSGLFGENTDLNKRMSKLIQETDINKIKIGPDAADADVLMRQRLPSAALMDTKSLLSSSLRTQSSSDSFDFIELTEAATKALGSPEKLHSIRKAMGTLDPLDNEKFLDELNLGMQIEVIDKDPDDRKMFGPKPPKLPPLDEESCSHSGHVTPSESPAMHLGSTRQKMFLPAVPAVLRSKTRRADRGYRSKDVLEARLKASKGTSSMRLLPDGVIRPLRKVPRGNNRSAQGELLRLVESRKRPSQESQDGHETDDCVVGFCSKDNEDTRGNDIKRRRRIPQVKNVDEEDLQTSPETMATSATSDRENDVEERHMLHNPLSMLVEAATGHRSVHGEGEIQVERSRRVTARRDND